MEWANLSAGNLKIWNLPKALLQLKLFDMEIQKSF